MLARGTTLDWILSRTRILLLACEGTSLEVEAATLVHPDWVGPSILGYRGFLERLRIALDPPQLQFHFGFPPDHLPGPRTV